MSAREWAACSSMPSGPNCFLDRIYLPHQVLEHVGDRLGLLSSGKLLKVLKIQLHLSFLHRFVRGQLNGCGIVRLLPCLLWIRVQHKLKRLRWLHHVRKIWRQGIARGRICQCIILSASCFAQLVRLMELRIDRDDHHGTFKRKPQSLELECLIILRKVLSNVEEIKAREHADFAVRDGSCVARVTQAGGGDDNVPPMGSIRKEVATS
mmetsp:Transcript_4556/g.12088  ORF Transcript_4556/g.12088 Transcript_4556/m.12088 type:complete len:208 (-) Transcript_4556:1766-2389(-)